jgi:protein-S-isoprenylcysteine O-methyltransferase Ste14
MLDRPLRKPVVAITALAVVLFVVSGVFKNGGGWRTVAGGVGWFGFLACLVALLGLAAASSVRGRRGNRLG